jgi:hypothetical protein
MAFVRPLSASASSACLIAIFAAVSALSVRASWAAAKACSIPVRKLIRSASAFDV